MRIAHDFGPSRNSTANACPSITRNCGGNLLSHMQQKVATAISCNVSAMVGTARCAIPARVAAGGMNIRATMALEGVAPLHAARTSQRDVPTTLNRYGAD